MIVRLLICILIIVPISNLVTQDIEVPYSQVLDHLLDNYYPKTKQKEFLSISRHPDGYYVGLQESDQVFSRKLYPYRLNGDADFRPLPFDRRTSDDLFAHHSTETVGHWRKSQFDLHLYFGYPGFTEQSIATLLAKKDRTPAETHMLARAHAEHAMNLLNNQYGTSDPTTRFQLDDERFNYLSPEQLEQYLSSQIKAIRYYGNLPYGYKTPVGGAQVKQANEWINAYLTLLQYNSRQVAEQFVNQMPPSYDEHLKLAARLLLESVPTNGILVVEGDNDTYPLIYLQLKENIRTDVLVVNRHLLNNPRYVHMLRKGKQVGGELNLSTPDNQIVSWVDQIFMPGDRYELYTAPMVLQALSNLSPHAQAGVIRMLPFGGMQLSGKVDGPLFRQETRPLKLGNLVMLDLIATNFKDGRQVAVSTTINQNYFAYANSWQQMGLVYNLGDEKPSHSIDIEGTVAWSSMLFQRSPIGTLGPQSYFLLDQLENIVVKTAIAFRKGGRIDMGVDIMNRYLSHLNHRDIFRRRSSLPLLKELNALGFDPVVLTAYASIMRDAIEEKPSSEHSSAEINTLRTLYYYIAHAEFPFQ